MAQCFCVTPPPKRPSEGKQEASPIRPLHGAAGPPRDITDNDLFIMKRLLETIESSEDIWNLCNSNKEIRDFCINTGEAADIFKRKLLKEKGVDLRGKTSDDIEWEYNCEGAENWLQVYRILSRRRFVQVSAGDKHSLGLLNDGTIIEWGRSGYGQTPVPPPKGKKFIQISACSDHSLGLLSDGTVMGWGDDQYGHARPPPYPPKGKKIIQISAGAHYSLGLLDDGTIVESRRVRAGGSARARQPPRGGSPSSPEGKRLVQISTGGRYSLGLLDDGTIVCWGDNEDRDSPSGAASGAVGGFARISAAPPITPPKGKRFVQISAGIGHALALLDDRTVVGWGYNTWGQANSPKGKKFVQISAGRHSLGLLDDGTVVGWGGDNYYHGDLCLPKGRKFIQISAGNDHSLGLLDDGTVMTRDEDTQDLVNPLDLSITEYSKNPSWWHR